jgi:hypothetical protein
MTRTTYTPEQKAEAVALATTIGPLRAGKRLGIPPRNVARWTHEPAASPIIARVEADIAERLERAHAKALAAVEAGLDDPNARLSDKAQSLRVLGDQSQLAHGRATQNIAVAGVGPANGEWPEGMVEWMDEARRVASRAFIDQYRDGRKRKFLVVFEDEREWMDELDDVQRARLRSWIDRLPMSEEVTSPYPNDPSVKTLPLEEVQRRDKAFVEAWSNRFADRPPDDLPSLVENPRVQRLPPERAWQPRALPATTVPEAEIRTRTNGTPVLVPPRQEPPLRRLIVNSKGEVVG